LPHYFFKKSSKNLPFKRILLANMLILCLLQINEALIKNAYSIKKVLFKKNPSKKFCEI